MLCDICMFMEEHFRMADLGITNLNFPLLWQPTLKQV